MTMRVLLTCFVSLGCSANTVVAQAAVAGDGSEAVLEAIDGARERHAQLARELWALAEVGYQEDESCALLAGELERAGFTVERGVAGMPTAFVASFGSGAPVLAVLGEFDALPGMSQVAEPRMGPAKEAAEAAPGARQPKKLRGGDAGHACGHNLFGPGSLAAVVAVKDWMSTRGARGTLRYYGTPAEEGGGGKLYMVRAGLFDDVDAVLAWHPADRNDPGVPTSLAALAADFTFHGVAAHASVAPDKGRSALDGLEAFDHMVNLMREHVPSDARIHYVITNGGKAPNIVPDTVSASYLVRHPKLDVLDDIWARVLKAAEGAALGTGTTMEWKLVSFYYPLLGNPHLTELQAKNMQRVGGVRYNDEERRFAEELALTLPPGGLPLGSQEGISTPDAVAGRGSTDVGDVSWVAPTTQFFAATWVPGTPPHTWQAVATSGTTIGEKGMLVAAKTLALTLIDLLSDPAHVAKARAQFEEQRGKHAYSSRIGDRPPPLDYRKRP
jgi:aminobenzoyl-glutamate utilization protein B